MKIRILFFLISSSIPIFILGQDKIYSFRTGVYFFYSSKEYEFNHKLLGFSKENGKITHIIEIGKIELSKKNNIVNAEFLTYEETIKEFEFNLGYQFEYSMFVRDKIINPFIGYEIDIDYYRRKNYPKHELIFDTKGYTILPKFNVIIGLDVEITNSFYLNFGIPIEVVRYTFVNEYVDNKVISKDNRWSSNSDFKFLQFDRLMLELNLGLRF